MIIYKLTDLADGSVVHDIYCNVRVLQKFQQKKFTNTPWKFSEDLPHCA